MNETTYKFELEELVTASPINHPTIAIKIPKYVISAIPDLIKKLQHRPARIELLILLANYLRKITLLWYILICIRPESVYPIILKIGLLSLRSICLAADITPLNFKTIKIKNM